MGHLPRHQPYKELPARGLVVDDAPVALSPLLGEPDAVWKAAERAAATELLVLYHEYVAAHDRYELAWRVCRYADLVDRARFQAAALMLLAELDTYPLAIRKLHEHAAGRPVQSVAVPRDYVLTVDRGFRLVCTCRYGHFACHHITGHDEATVTRQCTECAPPTSWKERRDA